MENMLRPCCVNDCVQRGLGCVNAVTIVATVETCGFHNMRLRSWAFDAAPPHVRRFFEGALGDVVVELTLEGYRVTVTRKLVNVSMLEWAAVTP